MCVYKSETELCEGRKMPLGSIMNKVETAAKYSTYGTDEEWKRKPEVWQQQQHVTAIRTPTKTEKTTTTTTTHIHGTHN